MANNDKFEPAGKDDNIKIVAIDMQQIIEEGKKPEISVKGTATYNCISSEELDIGVTIKAMDNNMAKERE